MAVKSFFELAELIKLRKIFITCKPAVLDFAKDIYKRHAKRNGGRIFVTNGNLRYYLVMISRKEAFDV
jgi:hypothetical protein